MKQTKENLIILYFEYKGRHEYGKEYITKSFEITNRIDNATAQMVWTSIRIEKTNIVKRGKKYKVHESIYELAWWI